MARGAAEMPFLDHLEELRWRLIWSFVALLVGCAFGLFAVAELDVLRIVERPIRGLLPDHGLSYTSPTTPFFVTLKLGFIVGLILAAPLTSIGINLFRELEDSGFFGDRDRDPESPGVKYVDGASVDAPPDSRRSS